MVARAFVIVGLNANDAVGRPPSPIPILTDRVDSDNSNNNDSDSTNPNNDDSDANDKNVVVGGRT